MSAGLVVLIIFVSIPFAAQQQDCLEGVIEGRFGSNGTIRVCPAIASQVPELQRKLTEIAKGQGETKEQLRELKRLIDGVNSVSRNIGEKRQVELLRNFSAQIGEEQSARQQQTQERIADLADKLDDLKNLLIEKLGDTSTRDRTATAVDGPVGDAIAKFDLTRAHDLLEDIRAQLNVIGGKVDESLKQGKDIKNDTAATRQLLEQAQTEMEQNQRLAAEQMKKDEAVRENDPRIFANVNIFALKAIQPSLPGIEPTRGVWQIKAIIGQIQSLADPTLQIAFRSGQNSWLMNAAWDGSVSWQVNADEVGDKAVVCFAAQDSRTGNRRQWTQSYTIQQAERGVMTRANFVPAGEPTLAPATGAPCDGVTQVRESARIESMQEQLAKMQRQLAQRGSDSAAMFGRIDVSAWVDRLNNRRWRIMVSTSPALASRTLYDIQVQMTMKGPGNKVWPVQLSNREITGFVEERYALLENLGTEAVVCFTAREPTRGQTLRMTKWFSIEASRVPGPNGYTAAFAPMREPTLEPASNAPCE